MDCGEHGAALMIREAMIPGKKKMTRALSLRNCRLLAVVLVIAVLLLAVPAGAYHICFGKACIPGVVCCDNHGTCTGYNRCTCNTGYHGFECDLTNYCGNVESTPVCSLNCTPWGSSATTESHGACLPSPLQSGNFIQYYRYPNTTKYPGYYGNIDYSVVLSYYKTSNFCACVEGWTGACCSNYQPGTLTPSVLDFGNVTVGAPAVSTAGVVLTNTMAQTNLTVQSITLTGTGSSDFAYLTNCAVNTNVPSLPGNCTFAFTFTPSATGTRIAMLNVNVSSDSGANNQIMTTTLTGTGITRVSSILVNPLDATNVFAGLSGAGIFRSTDSGSTWTAAGTQPGNTQITALVKQPGTGSTTLYAGTIGGGVYTSTDDGVSWSVCTNTGLSNTNVHSLIASSTGALYAGTENGVFVSTDACADWSPMNTGLP
ncbi:MAG: choice-of-anchor D domain-containing protein [Methanoregula sp.]|nr:choice-of-anchor D domain-containing protein [Methanoregula sp.]